MATEFQTQVCLQQSRFNMRSMLIQMRFKSIRVLIPDLESENDLIRLFLGISP